MIIQFHLFILNSIFYYTEVKMKKEIYQIYCFIILARMNGPVLDSLVLNLRLDLHVLCLWTIKSKRFLYLVEVHIQRDLVQTKYFAWI